MSSNEEKIKEMVIKMEVLKKAVLTERTKNSELVKELKQAKEELSKEKEKVIYYKEELAKYKNSSAQNQMNDLFNVFYNQNSNENSKENENEKELKEEIRNLKEKVDTLQKGKDYINSMLNDLSLVNENARKANEAKIDMLNKEKEDIKLQFEQDLKKIKYSYDKIISDKNILINQQTLSLAVLRENNASLDQDKVKNQKIIKELKQEIELYKKQVNEMKATIELKVNEMNELFEEQDHLLSQLDENKKEIQKLKKELREFKPETIDMNFVFEGLLIPKGKKDHLKKIEICFGKIKDCLYFKIENQEPYVVINEDISSIRKDEQNENRVLFNFIIEKHKNKLLCQFTKEEVQLILEFYEKIKVKPSLLGKILLVPDFSGFTDI